MDRRFSLNDAGLSEVRPRFGVAFYHIYAFYHHPVFLGITLLDLAALTLILAGDDHDFVILTDYQS